MSNFAPPKFSYSTNIYPQLQQMQTQYRPIPGMSLPKQQGPPMRMNHNQNMLNQSMANPASINRSPIDHRPTNISIANNTRNASYNDDKQKMENMSNDLMKLKSQLNNIMTKADSAQIQQKRAKDSAAQLRFRHRVSERADQAVRYQQSRRPIRSGYSQYDPNLPQCMGLTEELHGSQQSKKSLQSPSMIPEQPNQLSLSQQKSVELKPIQTKPTQNKPIGQNEVVSSPSLIKPWNSVSMKVRKQGDFTNNAVTTSINSQMINKSGQSYSELISRSQQYEQKKQQSRSPPSSPSQQLKSPKLAFSVEDIKGEPDETSRYRMVMDQIFKEKTPKYDQFVNTKKDKSFDFSGKNNQSEYSKLLPEFNISQPKATYETDVNLVSSQWQKNIVQPSPQSIRFRIKNQENQMIIKQHSKIIKQLRAKIKPLQDTVDSLEEQLMKIKHDRFQQVQNYERKIVQAEMKITRQQVYEEELQKQYNAREQDLMRVIRELRERPQEEERRVRTMFDEALKSQIEEIAHYKNQLLAKEDQISWLQKELQKAQLQLREALNSAEIAKKISEGQLKQQQKRHQIKLLERHNENMSIRRTMQTLESKLRVAVKQVKEKDDFICNFLVGHMNEARDQNYIREIFQKYQTKFPTNSISEALLSESKQIEQLKRQLEIATAG